MLGRRRPRVHHRKCGIAPFRRKVVWRVHPRERELRLRMQSTDCQSARARPCPRAAVLVQRARASSEASPSLASGAGAPIRPQAHRQGTRAGIALLISVQRQSLWKPRRAQPLPLPPRLCRSSLHGGSVVGTGCIST